MPRTREALDVLAANIRAAQAAVPVPLAVEDIAALISWPEDEMTEGQFLSELVERTGVLLLLDAANLHDTHEHPVPAQALDILAALAERRGPSGPPPGVLLERDDAYPPDAEMAAELAAIRAVAEGTRAPGAGHARA